MANINSELFRKISMDPRVNRREFLRTTIAAGLTMSAATSLWSGSVAASTPQRGGNLVQAMEGSSATSSLDPITYTNTYDANMGYQYAQRLLGNNPANGDYTFELATAIDSTDGGTTWVLKLREGVTFHNGKTMTSADVVYSLNRHRGADSKSGAAGSLTAITDIKASGKYEITITLDAVNADLPFIITDYHLLIQPEGSTDDGIGTGGYVMKEYRPGEVTLFEHNANYWGDGCWFDTVENLAINDATARTTALMTGKANLISRVDPKTAGLMNKNPKVVVENTSGRAHYVFLMQTQMAPFDNYDLRMAMKFAINREEIVKTVLRGYGSVGNDMPINAAYPYFDDSIEQRKYDPDQARFHFKKSGHSGSVEFHVSNAAFSGAEDAAVLYQQQAKRAGITIDVKREPADGYWDNVWMKKPFCASYWSGRPTQDQMYSVAYKGDAAWNDTQFQNENFDKLLLSARGELNGVKRKEIYHDMAMILRDQGGLVCPMFNDFIDARSSNLSGYVRDPLGAVSNGFAPMRCWFEA
ncbi:MAG: ABC transporter substrate-binding protein [Rhodospirillales bacterium]|nr:ABC transporter substrate-binding protein [Rhodospirillales bacterium]